MWLCWGSRDGGSKLILAALFVNYLKLDIFLILILLGPKLGITQAMFGEAFLAQK